MPINAAQLVVSVGANTSAAEKGLGGIAALMGKALPLAGVATVAAVAGIGIASVKMAGDFQESMTQLVTGAGESESNIKLVSDGILKMAVDTGTSTQQLSAGMFMIESAGHHGADGLNVLKVAAQGAKVGNADLGTTADALTTILKDYPNVTNGAAGAMNELIATVSSGKTHMQDLAGAMASILPAAASAGISLNDVMGAMATMTGEGVKADNAATFLRQTIFALVAPSKQTVDALKKLGLSSTDVARDMQKDMPGTLKMITDRLAAVYGVGTPQYTAALKSIAGGTKQVQGIMDLTGVHMQDFQSNVKNVSDQVKSGGKQIVGWSLVQQDFNFKVAKAKEVVETLMISLGTKLLPVAGKIVDLFATKFVPALVNTATFIGNVVTAIGNFVTWLHSGSAGADAVVVALTALGGAMAGLGIKALVNLIPTIIESITAFYNQAAAAWAAATGVLAAALPFILIGAAIGAVIAIIILLVTHWKQVSAFLGSVWKATVAGVTTGLKALGSFFSSVFAAIGTTVHRVVSAIVGVILWGFNLDKAIIHAVINFIVGLFKWLFDHNYYFHNLVVNIQAAFKFIQGVATAIWTAISGFIVGIWHGLQAAATAVFTFIVGIIKRDIDLAHKIISVVLGAISAVWNAVWGRVSGFVTAIWSNISGAVTSGITSVQNLVNGVGTWLGNFFGNLASTAIQWGSNLIGGFINGIKQMGGKVGDAAKGIASSVASFFGFHSPTKEGPGRDADQWAPNLIGMFARGILAGAAQVRDAAAAVGGAVAAGMGVDGDLGFATGGAAGGRIGLGRHLGAAAAHALPAGISHHTPHHGGHHGEVVIHLHQHIDGRKIAEIVTRHQPGVLRQATGIRSF